MTEEELYKKPAGKKWYYYLSPCVLLMMFCLLGMADSYADMEDSKGWSYLGVIILKPILISAAVVDILARFFLGRSMAHFLVVEIVAVVLILLIFLYRYI